MDTFSIVWLVAWGVAGIIEVLTTPGSQFFAAGASGACLGMAGTLAFQKHRDAN